MGGRDRLVRELRWQIEAGADEAIADAPVDRRIATKRAPQAKVEQAAATVAPPDPAPRSDANAARHQALGGLGEASGEFSKAPAAAVARPRPSEPAPELPGLPAAPQRAGAQHTAWALSSAAETLPALKAALERFDECALKYTATNLVFADGNPEAPIVLIGEAPGAEEDRLGLPFVGKAGRLLDCMLAAIGRDRGSAYITNILFWRPPGNRQPTAGEIAACLPFVERHIELLAPEVLVFLGGTAAKTLLGSSEGIMRLRGRWFEYSSPGLARPVAAMATFHPAYLLRSPGQKRAAWQDLLEIKAKLNSLERPATAP